MKLPIALIAAVVTQTLCQLFKVALYSIRDRRVSFKYFLSSGGMPSSHSAFVTALCVALAIHNGIASDAFAVAAVFGFIVIHDAYRLRGTVEKQSKALNLLAESRPPEARPKIEQLPEMIGHTLPEIAAGLGAGGLLGGAFALLLQRLVPGVA